MDLCLKDNIAIISGTNISDLKETPELLSEIKKINQNAWPQFLLNWECKGWSELFTTLSDYQIVLTRDETLIAYGYTIPIFWERELIDIPDDLAILVENGVSTYHKGIKPNILLALAAVVSPKHKGEGLSYEIVKAMKSLSKQRKIDTLIVPVRPTLKSKYPLIPIEKYSRWKTDDGKTFDPWLRVHDKLGGVIFKTAEKSMIIKGSVNEWEEWSNIKMLDSGSYVIEGALSPVKINVENDMGIYYDPCIWVKYEN